MKPSCPLCGLIAVTLSSIAVEVITYEKLVVCSQSGASPKPAVGKRVQIAAVGKGERGYFVKAADEVTFACDSGDKLLTSYKAYKGLVQGTW